MAAEVVERAPSLEAGEHVKVSISTDLGWSEAAVRALDGRRGTVTEVRVPEPGTGLALLGVGYLVRLAEPVPAEAIGAARDLAEVWLARCFLEPAQSR